jgi:quercetin dioxygenase-like cupin family protein
MANDAQANLAADKLKSLHRETILGMPSGDKQEVRVLYAALEPGDRTPRHFHHFPVTVYVQEGEFTVELEGRDPITIPAGETFIEPPHTNMVGYNASAGRTVTVLFFVCDPDTSFAELVK